jgi:hypothetical protein
MDYSYDSLLTQYQEALGSSTSKSECSSFKKFLAYLKKPLKTQAETHGQLSIDKYRNYLVVVEKKSNSSIRSTISRINKVNTELVKLIASRELPDLFTDAVSFACVKSGKTVFEVAVEITPEYVKRTQRPIGSKDKATQYLISTLVKYTNKKSLEIPTLTNDLRLMVELIEKATGHTRNTILSKHPRYTEYKLDDDGYPEAIRDLLRCFIQESGIRPRDHSDTVKRIYNQVNPLLVDLNIAKELDEYFNTHLFTKRSERNRKNLRPRWRNAVDHPNIKRTYWNENLDKEWQELCKYKLNGGHGIILPKEAKWTTLNSAKVQNGYFKNFLGWVKNENKVPDDQITIALIADFDLIQEYILTKAIYDEKNDIVKGYDTGVDVFLIGLCNHLHEDHGYFYVTPQKWNQNAYLKRILPTHETVGNKRHTVEVELKDKDHAWQYLCELTREKILRLKRNANFERSRSSADRITSELKTHGEKLFGMVYKDLLRALEVKVNKAEIHTYTHAQRMAVTALFLFTGLRKGTVEALTSEHLYKDNVSGRWTFDIPRELYKNRRRKSLELHKGPVHQDLEPFLDNYQDACNLFGIKGDYFFVNRKGNKIAAGADTRDWTQRWVPCVSDGINPHAFRGILATATAFTQGAEAAALMLSDTTRMIKENYDHTTNEMKSAKRNNIVSTFIQNEQAV